MTFYRTICHFLDSGYSIKANSYDEELGRGEVCYTVTKVVHGEARVSILDARALVERAKSAKEVQKAADMTRAVQGSRYMEFN